MNKDFLYRMLLRVAEECRRELINDTLGKNSPDLYDALYSNIHSEIFHVKMDLYELLWIELHWKKIMEAIEKQEFTPLEKKKAVSQCADWYLKFISEWQYTEFDSLVMEEKKNILKALVFVNNEWENNIKRMKVSFEQDRKKLNKRIKELERGVQLCQ